MYRAIPGRVDSSRDVTGSVRTHADALYMPDVD
jgi:hypothetical protein